MQVEGLDHVHVEVTDRQEAAVWYADVLGLKPHADFARWATHPQGPLILAAANGAPTLSLFAGNGAATSRDATVAFRVGGAAFLAFLEGLAARGLRNRFGKAVTPEQVQDHEISWSLYFVDPDQNRLELTTYDYDVVSASIGGIT